MNIGVLYRQKAAWSKSVDYLEKAIELAPHHAEAVHNLAITYEQQKNLTAPLSSMIRCWTLTQSISGRWATRAPSILS